MQEVKNKNIRIKNLSSFTGLLMMLFFVINYSPASAQVELDFSKWQSFQKDNAVLAFAKQQGQTPSYSSERRNTTFKPVQNFTVRCLPDICEYPCLGLTTAGKRELGFFCKLDLRMDKTMYMPFRFRLGNLEYVNKLEGYWR